MIIEEVLSDINPKERHNHPGQYNSRCPFRENHQDGSGRKSFYFSTDENWYHCFSCHESGALHTLLTTRFNLSVFDALETVNVANLDDLDSNYERRKKSYESRSSSDILIPRRRPTKYLDRGFSPDELAEFRVGSEINEDGNEQIYIPLEQDGKQKGVYFIEQLESGSRSWTSDDFDKSAFLYGEDKIPKDTTDLVIVEGPADTWRTYFRGHSVGGLLGTSMSWDLLNRIRRKFPKLKNVYLCTDNDDAGILAREKLYLQLRNYYDCWFVPYEGEDPDATSNAEWNEAIENPDDYLTYSVQMNMIRDDYESMQDKALKWYDKEKKELT